MNKHHNTMLELEEMVQKDMIKLKPHSLVITYKAISKPVHEKFSFLGVIKQSYEH